MNTYNRKCKGCGNFLSSDRNSLGYIPKLNPNLEDQLCQRCFRLKHYNEIIDNQTIGTNIEKTLSKLDVSKSNVFIVVDILDIKNTIIPITMLNGYKKLFIVLNKIDRLPSHFNHVVTNENVKATLSTLGIHDSQLIYTSIKNNSSIKRLSKVINDIKRNETIHFLGKSNTGKTSLINALLKLNKQTTKLISSPYINTTLDFKKVYISKTHSIIDSPGFIDQSNILNFIDKKHAKLINNEKQISKNFSLNTHQAIMIEKLAIISYLEGEKCNFNFYISQQLRLLRSKMENSITNINNKEILVNMEYIDTNIEFKELEFDLLPNKKYNLSINGLCSISIGYEARKIKVLIHPKVEVKINEFAII